MDNSKLFKEIFEQCNKDEKGVGMKTINIINTDGDILSDDLETMTAVFERIYESCNKRQ